MPTIVTILILATAVLVVYHHVLYPLLLDRLAKRRRQPIGLGPARGWSAGPADRFLPRITVVVPAYDERAVIADKVRNLAILDYPADRLRVLIVCDGCTDDTAARARAAAGALECRDLAVEVIERPVNGGKVALLNDVVAALDSEIVALTDASALVSFDALLIAAAHFADPRVGVVCATYRMLEAGSVGERVYWAYQTRIKEGEAALGAPIGAHGAFYAFRRALFEPLPADTINDDFVLPMRIVAAGYRSLYDTRIVAVEMEPSSPRQDYRRRLRIAAGNVQQVLRLRRLLLPHYAGTAFAFASGKAMRAILPFLLCIGFFASFAFAATSPVLAAAFVAQVLVYAVALLPSVFPTRRWPSFVASLGYLVTGHVAGLVGATGYLFFGQYRRSWSGTRHRDTPAQRTTRRFNEYLAGLGLRGLGGPFRDEAGGGTAEAAGGADSSTVTHVHPLVRSGKRAVDLVGSSILLVLALPLLPFVAAAIRLDSPGPVFFRQLRIGESRPDHTRLFQVVKFRSMRVDAEAGSGAVWASEDDPRVTRVGRFLRRTRLDELPQLYNVLRGDMSLIGPRPERPGFFAGLDRMIPYYGERVYGVVPGITGFAQVHNRADQTIDDVRVKLYYDHAYALALSQPGAWVTLDLWVATRTVAVMAFGPGMVERKRPECIYND